MGDFERNQLMGGQEGGGTNIRIQKLRKTVMKCTRNSIRSSQGGSLWVRRVGDGDEGEGFLCRIYWSGHRRGLEFKKYFWNETCTYFVDTLFIF